MIKEHQTTPEEGAYERLRDEARETLSWPARALFGLAEGSAYADHMLRNCGTSEKDYDEAEDKLGFVAAGLTDRGQKPLTEIVRATRTAAGVRCPSTRGATTSPAKATSCRQRTRDGELGAVPPVGWRRP